MKKKTATKSKPIILEETQTSTFTIPPKIGIQPITETFGQADLNTLRDKINEIITHR